MQMVGKHVTSLTVKFRTALFYDGKFLGSLCNSILEKKEGINFTMDLPENISFITF